MSEASPAKWHLAHTTWFFETFVLEAKQPGFQVCNEAFRVLFNSYYNGIGKQHPRAERGLLTRPSLTEVQAYRAHVDQSVAGMLDRNPTPEVEALVELGLNHEQQHQELILMDIKHLLSQNPMDPVYAMASPGPRQTAPDHSWVAFPAGVRWIGHSGHGFAYDNEGPRHRVFLEAFELGSRPVTCGDFLDFIGDDGYRRPELWLDEGWAAIKERGWEAPLYWSWEPSGQWSLFTLRGRQPVDPEQPVCHLSYFEADAFARWAGARLPTECEWEAALGETDAQAGAFLDQGHLHPVTATSPRSGPTQMLGWGHFGMDWLRLPPLPWVPAGCRGGR